MEPDILYLIVCDDVRADPNNYHRLNIFGLLISLRSQGEPAFPLVRPSFSALVILTNGQGGGELRVQVVHEQTGQVIFSTRPRQVRFIGDPTAVLGMRFQIQNCSFPAAGLNWVEVAYDGSIIARQRLFLTT